MSRYKVLPLSCFFLSICLSAVCLSVRPSVCPSVRPSVRLSVCPSVRLSVCTSVRPHIHPSVCLISLTRYPLVESRETEDCPRCIITCGTRSPNAWMPPTSKTLPHILGPHTVKDKAFIYAHFLAIFLVVLASRASTGLSRRAATDDDGGRPMHRGLRFERLLDLPEQYRKVRGQVSELLVT